MKELKIDVKRSENDSKLAIVKFSGDLTSNFAKQIDDTIEKIISDGYFYVIAEMSDALSISSSVIGELMGCRTKIIDVGGDLVFCGLKLSVKEKLSSLDANKIFKIYLDTRSAINAYEWEYKNRRDNVEISFPSHLRFVPPVRRLISRISLQKGYSSRDAFRIETIIDEVCNNAIEHGIIDSDNDVELIVNIDRKKIEIKVINISDPKKIDMLKKLTGDMFVPKSDDDDDKRGRGLALVKMLSNDFKIEYSEIGTSVHVTKVREE